MTKTPAQALLDEVVQSALAPMLKGEGFRKSARTFRRTAERCVLVLNVQASQWSTKEELEFTVNLGVFYPELNGLMQVGSWADPRTSGPTESSCHVRERLGNLTENRRDTWWQLRVGEASQAVAREVMEAVRDRGLPWLREMADFESAWRHAERRGRLVHAAALAVLVGQRDEARRILIGSGNETDSPPALRTWARQFGLLD